MRFFDEKFRDNKFRYIAQAALGGIAAAAALVFFDVVNHPAIIASFGASTLVAFAAPHQRFARPRYLVGGYIIGVTVGCLIHYVTIFPIEPYLAQKLIHLLAGGVAVGLAIFFMAVTNTEHAPAAGIALGFVINDWTFHTVVMVMIGIIVISAIQRILRPWMIDLI